MAYRSSLLHYDNMEDWTYHAYSRSFALTKQPHTGLLFVRAAWFLLNYEYNKGHSGSDLWLRFYFTYFSILRLIVANYLVAMTTIFQIWKQSNIVPTPHSYCHGLMRKMFCAASIVPRPLPDCILQPQQNKIGRGPGTTSKSWSSVIADYIY